MVFDFLSEFCMCISLFHNASCWKILIFFFSGFFLRPLGKQVHKNTLKNSEDVPVEGEEDMIDVESLLDVAFE